MNNRVIHFEIQVDDPARAKKFYENVLGWKIGQYAPSNPENKVPMDYWMLDTGTGPGINGGMYKRSDGRSKLTTFDCTVQVPDIDKAIEDVKANGGTISSDGKVEMKGLGFFARATDTEGNVFGLMQPTEWQAK